MTSMPLSLQAISSEQFKDEILRKLTLAVGKDPEHAVPRDWLIATSLVIRDQLVIHWMESTDRFMPIRRSAFTISPWSF